MTRRAGARVRRPRHPRRLGRARDERAGDRDDRRGVGAELRRAGPRVLPRRARGVPRAASSRAAAGRSSSSARRTRSSPARTRLRTRRRRRRRSISRVASPRRAARTASASTRSIPTRSSRARASGHPTGRPSARAPTASPRTTCRPSTAGARSSASTSIPRTSPRRSRSSPALVPRSRPETSSTSTAASRLPIRDERGDVSATQEPLLSLRHRLEELSGRAGARRRQLRSTRSGRGPRARRGERRGQVDAREDPRRGASARQRRDSASTGSEVSSTARQTRGRRHRDHLPGADPLPRPDRRGEHLHRPPAARRRPPHRLARACARTSSEVFERLGVDLDPARIARGLVDRRAADRRDRQGALARRARLHDHGRADRGALGRRGRAALRVVAELRDAGAAVLFISPPPRGDLRALPTRSRCCATAGWVDEREPSAGFTADDLVRADGRPRARARVCPKAADEIGDVVLQVERLDARGVLQRCLVRGEGRRDRRARRARRRRPDARSRARSSASTATTPGRSTISGRGLRRASPTAAMSAGVGLVPEDRRQQGLVMDDVDLAQHRARVAAGGCSARVHPLRVASAASPPTGRCGFSSSTGGSRNPANRSPAATSRRSCSPSGSAGEPTLLIVDEPTRGIDIGTKAEVHRLLDELAGQGVADPDDLLRAAGGAAASPTGSSSCARDGSSPSSPTPRPARRRIVAAATGQLDEEAA